MECSGLRHTDSPLSRDITTLRFPKKFVMSSFDHNLGTSDPLIHLRQYQDKMALYAHNDLLFYRAFPSSLKGVTYHWFYSLPRNSLWNYHEVTNAFYNQFASWRKIHRNSNHLLIVKMKTGESLKNYINYFQSQIALVYNYNENIATTALISWLQVTNPFYKYLVKNDVTKIRDIRARMQKYIQIEEVTGATSSRLLRQGP